ncbi:MAG TPA: APC family permease [Gaiellaceae bacterium]|nr:APC family permease [Gaiellaceae bacterium]
MSTEERQALRPGPPGRAPLRRAIVGRPMATGEMEDTLLPKFLALPIFASDPLSSVAYATEAGMVVLLAASAGALHLILPISIAIAALLAIVAISYTQTVKAYETSGGAYVVAKDNLGTLPSLVAGAALLTDYVLTVAVSVAAGVLAITSAAPSLAHLNVELSLGAIVLITLVNLRGVRESGVLFALPTYAFLASLYALIGVGLWKIVTGNTPHAVNVHPLAAGTGAVGIFVVLRAFASGSSALTGVEAISNGVSAFRRPQSKNAARTLVIMAGFAISLFLGVSLLAVKMHAHPSSTDSVLSEIARGVFPSGSFASALYYVIQGTTFAILIFAANTSYQGFPRLAALLARDRFFPRQFVNLGDRLVYSNGIVVLTGLAAALIVAFSANVNSLIHLYVVGVFTAFTLSQAGMVRYWRRTRGPGWQRRAVINGIGSTATGIVTLLVIETKFTEGAWAVIVAIPLMVVGFYAIKRHYARIGRRLRAGAVAIAAAPPPTNTVVLYVESFDEATRLANWYSREVSGNEYHPVHVLGSSGRDLRGRWWDWSGGGTVIEALEREDRPAEAVLDYVWQIPRGESSFVTVVIPEQFRRASLLTALTRRTAFSLKLRLLREPGVVISDVPVVGPDHPLPKKLVCRVFVSGGHAASLRAANYAQTLGIKDTRAVSFAFDAAEAQRMQFDWAALGTDLQLEIDEAHYRDIGEPLLNYVRELTADPDTVVSVILPEIVVSGVRRALHNQRAIYLKRLLLFEPRVILSSVPYQLG